MTDRGNEKRVLVVLNDAHTRMTIHTTLERAGLAVELIDDGDEALAACRARRPDVLIVGSRLTKMDGFVFLYKLKGDGLSRVIPTIVVAEANEKGREGMAVARGAKAFLLKPVKVRKLLEHVLQLASADSRMLDEQHRRQVAKLAERDERASEEPPEPQPQPKGPIRVAHKLVERVQRSRNAVDGHRGGRHELLEKLRGEVRRLKGLPYHKRLELEPTPKADDVDTAFRRLAMRYHPDRYKHHGNDARRLAQGVFMLLNDAKKALRPSGAATASSESAAPAASDSWHNLPPRRTEPPRNQQWTPAMIDFEELEAAAASEPEASAPPPVSSASGPGADSGDRQSGDRQSSDRDSSARVAPPERAVDEARVAALTALAEGRYRDAKNQLGRLLDQLEDGETDTELALSDKLARGYLRQNEGYPEDALELFEEALALAPDCAEALTAVADVKEELDQKSGGLFSRLLGKK